VSADKAAGLALEPFAQALREAHCARGDADHPCIGKVTIDREGVQLECKACGSERVSIAPSPSSDEVAVARAAFGAIGLDWQSLSPIAQRYVFDAIKRLDLVRRRGMP
jgi:hypothetical protein